MWIGTFHGLCNRFLRAHYREAGLPQTFQILDSADQLAMVKRLLKNLNIDDEKYPPRELCHFINAHKEQGVRAGQAEVYDSYTQKRVEIYAEYEAQCNREGVVDFAELLLRCYELLQRNEPLRAHYQQRFRHILVDEFQDTNLLQYAWLKLLAGGGASVFAVGDDDQSIYRFRGAEVGNMRDFEREYAGPNIIRLEQNYRSQGNILAAANAIIKNNRERLGKNLWTDAGEGEPIRAFEAYSDLDEARFVVEEIRELVRDGVSPTQIAVLYRANAQSRVIENELFTKSVPYKVYGGLRFFERQEIKHALAYLRLLGNPDDDTAFLRVVNFPTRGIGARSLENLQAVAHQCNSSLYNAAASLTGKAGQTVGAFIRLVETLRQETEGLPLPEMVEHVIERSGLAQHYRTEKEGQDRLENLDELINAAATFVDDEGAIGEGGALVSFLTLASLEAGEHQAGEGDDALQLMTTHSAKGLEFNVVFLSGLEEGLFPHENSLVEPKGLEEERRLMYVAVTRARRRLYLSHAQTRMLHGQTRYNLPSRFIEEIPAGLVKWLTPKVAKQYGVSPRLTFEEPRASYAPRSGSGTGYRIGQAVRHAKFGEGIIVNLDGGGEDARAQINFGGAGMKWLALSVAKLETV
jgi:DNA helicase-2/ATP-dependent DNA helicase PcrA